MEPSQCTFSGSSVLGKSPPVRAASLLVCCWVEAPSLLWGLPCALGLGALLMDERLSQ